MQLVLIYNSPLTQTNQRVVSMPNAIVYTHSLISTFVIIISNQFILKKFKFFEKKPSYLQFIASS